jgi:uncharacterized protein YndB with AHSA1/START domain
MPDIMHLIKIKTSPDQVYRALTTAEGIRNWWTRDATIESKIGGIGEFRFYDGKGVTKIRVDELKASARAVWKTISANAPGGWDSSTITFDLRREGDGTVLSFAHRGLADADDGYALVNTGWGYYLVSLRQYLETGEGGPHPGVDFARMLK